MCLVVSDAQRVHGFRLAARRRHAVEQKHFTLHG
jgi:hypothetical protein